MIDIHPQPATITTLYPVLDTAHDDPMLAGLGLADICARMARLYPRPYGSRMLRPCADPGCREWERTEQRPTRWTHYHGVPAEVAAA